jgi:molecular chaperone IbpA
MTNDVFSFNTTNFDKFFVGADSMLKSLATAHDAYAKAIPGYPPYNIIKNDDTHYTIEMAVAGFGKQNIDIELANNTLTIKGGLSNIETLDETSNPVMYMWKGIADRMFTRKFALADTVEVKNAELVNGILKVFLENVVPESKKPKKVDIK